MFIVPCQTDVPTQLSSLSRAQSIIEQESSPASLIDPHQSSSSYREESDDDSSLTSNPRAGYHRLNLKTDSSTFLSAPKSGIEGKYFLLKTELSHSKSTFTTDLQPLQPSKVAQKPSSLSSPSSTSSLSPLRNSIYKDSHPHQLAPLDLPADYSRSSRKGENTSSPTKRSPTKRLKPLARDLSTQSIK